MMDADSSYGGSDTAHDLHSSHEDSAHHINSSPSPHPRHDDPAHQVNHAPIAVDSAHPPAVAQSTHEVTLNVCYDEDDDDEQDHVIDSNKAEYMAATKINVGHGDEPHSNLEETSRNFRSTNRLNESPPPVGKGKGYGSGGGAGGVENPAFVGDVKSTFNHEKPYNGDLNGTSLGVCSLNKSEEPMTEAVNLELINMKPVGTNGTDQYDVGNGLTSIPLKKENNRDIGNPYDEYFVPVNEHRKYMRGEKLYVTKDKRGEKSKSKCFCWAVCLGVVALALIIGILAAVGVIGGEKSKPQEVARKLDNPEQPIVKGGLSIPGGSDSNKPPPLTPEPPLSTVSPMLPTTELSGIIVPRALESQLTIDNLQYSPDLANKNSSEYRALAESLENMIKSRLFSKDMLQYGPADIEVKVMEFLPGSVIVKYRVGWKFKQGIHSPRDPIDENTLKKRMTASLDKNNGLMDQFHVLTDSLKSEKILDLCKIENNDCEHVCVFDYQSLNFACLCPEGKHVGLDGKSCIAHAQGELEHAHVQQHHPEHDHDHEPSAEPEPEPSHDHEPSAQPEPAPNHDHEPSAEPKPSHDHDHEPSVQPEPEPTHDHDHEPSAEPEPEPSHDYDHEPSAELEPSHDLDQEPSAEPEPEPSAEDSSSSAEREPKSQSEPDLKQLTVEPVEAQPEPSPEPEPSVEPLPSAEPQPEPSVEPLPSEPETSTKPKLTEPMVQPATTSHQPYSEPSTTISNHLVHHHDESRAFHDHVIFAEPETITQSPTTSTMKPPLNTTTAEPTTVPSTTESLKFIPLNDLLIEHHDLSKIVEFTTVQPVEQVEDDLNTTEEPFDLHAAHQEIHPDDFYYGNVIPNKEKVKTVVETSTEEVTTMVSETRFNGTTIGESVVEVIPSSSNNGTIASTTTSVEVVGSTVTFNDTEPFGGFNQSKEVETFTTTTEQQNTTMEKMTLLPKPTSAAIQTTNTSKGIESKIILPEAEVITTTAFPEETTTDSGITEETEELTEDYNSTTTEAEITTVTPSSIEENEVTHPLIIPVVIRESPDYYGSGEVSGITTMKPEGNVIEKEEVSKSKESPSILGVTTMNPEGNVTEKEEVSRSNESPLGPHENSTVDHLEHMHDEYMSPFLPELENDTFINSLHSEEGFLQDHKEGFLQDHREDSHENASVTKPPSLEFDQLNHTNPFDNDTSDASLGIIPLRREEGDNATLVTTVSGKGNVSASEQINTTDSNITETITMQPEKTETTITTTTQPSLPPEIINNVHSNPIFEKHFSKTVENATNETPQTENSPQNEPITDTLEISTTETIPEMTTMQMVQSSTTMESESNEINSQTGSTEDLVAMETTTKKVFNETTPGSAVSNGTKPDNSDKPENLLTLETTTTTNVLNETVSNLDTPINTSINEAANSSSVNFEESIETSTKTAGNEISAEDLLALETTTKNDKIEPITIHGDILETVKTDVKVITEDDNDITGSSTSEPVSYKVRELVSDITTTEKLFVRPKITTTTETNEDLSVEPLADKKEITFNNIPSSEGFNDITEESSIKETSDKQKSVISDQSKCSIGEFQCTNGTSVRDGSYCVSNGDRCDSVLDCSDGSDEEGCEKEGCLTNFQCASGQCLKRHLVCDGIVNCNDGSDELNCDSWSCKPDEHSCGTGQRCIPLTWKCDGKSHCQDGSDEKGCQFNQCHNDSFHCKAQGRCIPMSWRCDGKSDCIDGEDEKSCDCYQDEFKCVLGGGCVPKSSICDGTHQCADRSDEWNCLRSDNSTDTEKKTLQWRSLDGTWYPICMDWVVWNTTYADRACRRMGYTGSGSLESVPKPDGWESRGTYELKGGVKELKFGRREGSCEQFVSIACQEHTCGGSSNLDVSSARIVGGNKASITQWPSLGILHNMKSNVYCTATLLTPLWVIAGYSCVVANSNAANAENWVLYVGSTNKSDNSSGQARMVQEIIPHPQVKFSEFEFVNDLVLVQIQKPVTINLNVSTICLPERDLEPRQLCIVAGWGVNKPGESQMQQYLHYLPVPMIDSIECNSTKYYNGKLDSDKICAGFTSPDKTPCYNDEGAPLMCYSDPSASWELRGLLSHHSNCGTSHQPAVYTTLDKDLRSWIKATIGNQAFQDAQ